MKLYLIIPAVLLMLASVATAASPKPAAPISVSVSVPDGGWSIKITEIRIVEDHTIVVSQLTRKPGMAIQAIRTIRATADARPIGTVKHFVLGKTWKWGKNTPTMSFVKSTDELPSEYEKGKRIYPADKEAE